MPTRSVKYGLLTWHDFLSGMNLANARTVPRTIVKILPPRRAQEKTITG